MAKRNKDGRVSFRIEDCYIKEIEDFADLEEKSVSDFLRDATKSTLKWYRAKYRNEEGAKTDERS